MNLGARTEPIRAGALASEIVVEQLEVLATMDENNRELSDAWVAIRDGMIVDLGTGDTQDVPGRRVDGRGLVGIPGLVNTHHHFFQNLTRVLPVAQGMRILDWLAANYQIWSQLDEEAVYTTARVAVAELLYSGCTTSSDHL